MKELAELLQTTPLWVLAVGLAIYSLIHGRILPWFEYLTKAKQREVDLLRTYVAEGSGLSPTAKALLLDKLEAKLMRQFLGIYAEHRMRLPLKQLMDVSSEKIDWHTVRMAWPHLELRDNHLRMKAFPLWRKIWWWFNHAFLFITLVPAMFFLSASLYSLPDRPALALFLFIYGVSFLFLATLARQEVHSVYAALRVEKEVASHLFPSAPSLGSPARC